MWSPFERKRRRVARTALYSSLGFSALVLALALGLDPGHGFDPYASRWSAMDFESMPDVRLLQDLIRIDSTAETGDQYRLASYIAQRLDQAGLDPHLEKIGENRAILWAEVAGVDPEPLVLLGHLDVEPVAHPENWKYDPFEALIDGPWIVGRGSYDMKSLLAAQIRVMEELAKGPTKPKRSVLFLALSDEESGSDLGAKLFIRRYPEMWKRFWAILTEGGILESRDESEIKYWGIEVAQKRQGRINLCSYSRDRLAAIRQSLKPLSVPMAQQYLRLTPPVEAFLKQYGPTRDSRVLRELLMKPEELVWEPQVFRRKAVQDHSRLPINLQALFRDEVHFQTVQEARGGGFWFPISFQLLPDTDFEEVLWERFPEFFELGDGVSSLLRPPAQISSSSLDHPLYRHLVESTGREFSPDLVGPLVLWYQSTDAKYFRPLGVPTYGYSPFVISVADTTTVGLPDERMILTGYLEGVDRFVRIVSELVS